MCGERREMKTWTSPATTPCSQGSEFHVPDLSPDICLCGLGVWAEAINEGDSNCRSNVPKHFKT